MILTARGYAVATNGFRAIITSRNSDSYSGFVRNCLQSTELSALLRKLPVVVGELEDGLSLLGRHLPGDHRTLFTPTQAGVSMPLSRLGTPAIALPAASIDLVKGSPQEMLMAEDLPEQLAVVGEEGQQLSLGKRA